MQTDEYLTLAEAGEILYKEKGSKFFTYAYPLQNQSDVTLFLDQLKEVHPKARHYCYAYVWGHDEPYHRSNDDGEPSGTAGPPILRRIIAAELKNVLVVVVRFFGGTLLGASGLIRAYKKSTDEVLAICPKITKVREATFSITFEYGIMNELLNSLKRMKLEPQNLQMDTAGSLNIDIPNSIADEQIIQLKAYVLDEYLENVSEKTEVPGLTIHKN